MPRRESPTRVLVTVQAVAATAALLLASPMPGSRPAVGLVSADIGLVSNTLLAMGGNTNPTGLTPDMGLLLGGDQRTAESTHGLVNTRRNPDSPFYGWDFDVIEWPAQIWLPILGNWAYEPAQREGQRNFATTLDAVLPSLAAGEQIVALGYSSSANVMVRQMRALQNQADRPADEQLSFILVGNPNRPNGGVLQRFSGAYIPFVDIPMDGSTPTNTPYRTTDISWEYDPASDFPLYPLNLLAVLNSLVAGFYLHSDYLDADIDGPRALPDTTVGAVTYITLAPPRLPLLMPFEDAGVPGRLLDVIEPALTAVIDSAYDRSIDPGTPTTARFTPPVRPSTVGGTATLRPTDKARTTRAVRAARTDRDPGHPGPVRRPHRAR